MLMNKHNFEQLMRELSILNESPYSPAAPASEVPFDQLLSQLRVLRERASHGTPTDRYEALEALSLFVGDHREHVRRDDLAAQLKPQLWQALEQLDDLARARDMASEIKLADLVLATKLRRRRSEIVRALGERPQGELEALMAQVRYGMWVEELSRTILAEWGVALDEERVEHAGGAWSVLSRSWLGSKRPWQDWHQVMCRQTQARRALVSNTPYAEMIEVGHVFGGSQLYDSLYHCWERAQGDCQMALWSETGEQARHWCNKVSVHVDEANQRGLIQAAFEVAAEVVHVDTLQGVA